MKKTVVFMLLSLAVVLTTGGYFFHKAHLISYKKEFKSYIKAHKNNIPTTQLTISDNELYVNTNKIVWVDDNKEIYYKGKLYDVITITHQQNKVVLTLLSDENEQKLKEDFASLYNNDEIEKSNHKPIKLLKQFLTLKYVTPPSICLTVFNLNTVSKPFANFSHKKNDVFLPQETPPPNFS